MDMEDNIDSDNTNCIQADDYLNLINVKSKEGVNQYARGKYHVKD